MTIIISKDGKNASKLDKLPVPQEEYLQKYIYNNPDSIPLYEIKQDIRLLVAAREFPTGSGSIDALALDNEGEIYLIETKLFKNQDKRKVIAQVLDYGASLWKNAHSEDFINTLEEKANKTFGMSLNDKLKQFFTIDDEEVTILKENVRANLSHGNFKFVVLMDELHDELKDLIVFINQNSRFDIFAVQMEYYEYQDFEIMIPKLYGAEVKKETSTGTGRIIIKWNKEKFDTHTRKNLTDEQYKAVEALYKFSKDMGGEFKWGTGQKGSFSAIISGIDARSIYSVYTHGRLTLNFWLEDKQVEQRYKQLLLANNLFGFPANFDGEHYSVPIDEWLEHREQFQNIITDLLER